MILVALAIYIFAHLSPPNATALTAWNWMTAHVFICVMIVLVMDGGGLIGSRRRLP